MKILPLLYAVVLLTPALVLAQTETVSFQGSIVVNKQVRSYSCRDSKQVSVLYINTANDSFAYLPVDGKRHVFVTVLSASGAKYASGPYVWWTKGRQANLTRDGVNGMPPLLAECVEQPQPGSHD
jgi:membrane-bound inhibitor of C-type lysozyme